ncbi:MAG TPA: CoA transferase [Stellaceae bacterium]|nr:CoA transferase [Stellaceae bacterium]
MAGPLDGVRVIDLTAVVLGPVATQILGDLGADIIKIEPPEGEVMRSLGPAKNPGMAAYFLNVNRNKKSVVLDLKRPAARDALLRLAATADVLVHNMRPGAARRLGIAYEAVAAKNPRLIYAAASGWRADSPHSDRGAFDDIIQGESGFAALNKDTDGSPRYAPMVIADKLTGYVLASMVGMALYAREKTGLGQEIHVPMMDTLAAFNLVDHLWHGVFGEPEKGLGYPRMLTPQRRPYATADGHVCLLATTDRQWRNLFAALGASELADDPRYATIEHRTANINELYTWLAGVLKTRSTAEWRAAFDAADVPNGGVNDLMGVVRDPYLREAGFFQEIDHPSEGRLTTMPFPVSFSDTTLDRNLPPPRLGEHTEEVLRDLGYSPAEIGELING